MFGTMLNDFELNFYSIFFSIRTTLDLIHIFYFLFQLNDMNLMEMDATANERRANPLDGIKKTDLNIRLQPPKQYEMDWEQFNWVRSVNASDQQIKITVNFT